MDETEATTSPSPTEDQYPGQVWADPRQETFHHISHLDSFNSLQTKCGLTINFSQGRHFFPLSMARKVMRECDGCTGVKHLVEE